ncbi:MAG: hypothetical protein ABI689_01570 [Thermoanaerobaculia bacterium]
MASLLAGTTREEEALAGMGRTQLSPVAAPLLTVLFLLVILSGAAFEVAAGFRGLPNLLRGESRLDFPSLIELRALWRERGALAATGAIRAADGEAQDRFDRESRLATALRAPLQGYLARRLHYGNSQVLLGDQDWLFFRDDFDYLTGPPFLAPAALARRIRGASRHRALAPDPVPAILGLAADLQARGIGFVIVPVPTKLGIAWERFVGRRVRDGQAIDNPSREEFFARLRRAGVTLFDPTPILRGMEIREEKPYMQFDSHWSPAGIDQVAAGLSELLASRFELGSLQRFHRKKRRFNRRADLADLLGLDPDRNPYLIESLEIQTVDGPGTRPFSSRRGEGSVLLVGDSFSRLLIRNRRKGGDANFAAQIAFHLQRPVDMLAENDAGADFARRVEWLRQPHKLDGRTVVIFEFAERALALGDWTSLRLAPPG